MNSKPRCVVFGCGKVGVIDYSVGDGDNAQYIGVICQPHAVEITQNPAAWTITTTVTGSHKQVVRIMPVT